MFAWPDRMSNRILLALPTSSDSLFWHMAYASNRGWRKSILRALLSYCQKAFISEAGPLAATK